MSATPEAANDSGATTLDRFLDGQLLLRQPRQGHRAGHDAMLLADATAAKAGDHVVEFGTGVGAAGLALARRLPGLDLVLVEIDPALAALAAENAAANGIAARTVVLDVGASASAFAAAGLAPDSADAVLMNPPFNTAGRHQASPSAGRERAHQADATTLATWIHAARRILKPGGGLTLIWRADELAAVLAAFDRGLGSLHVTPVHARADTPAIRILVSAVKGGRASLVLAPGRVLAA